jgi:hypothetical protein
MNGRTAKKIRKESAVNFKNVNVVFIKAVMQLPFKERLKFGIAVLLKKKWS